MPDRNRHHSQQPERRQDRTTDTDHRRRQKAPEPQKSDQGVRAKSSGQKKRTADKWNQ
jgi:hypothetical protein